MNPRTGWEGILDDGETVLWQGRPNAAIVFRASHLVSLVFGLFFSGFALFWMIMASQAGGIFWMFGLIHFFVGLGVAFGPITGTAWRRRHTWYTLTNQRAFVATDLPFSGRRLKSYPITRDSRIAFEPGPLSSIHFAHEYQTGRNGSVKKPIGFDRIKDGETVYALIRDIQRGTV